MDLPVEGGYTAVHTVRSSSCNVTKIPDRIYCSSDPQVVTLVDVQCECSHGKLVCVLNAFFINRTALGMATYHPTST